MPFCVYDADDFDVDAVRFSRRYDVGAAHYDVGAAHYDVGAANHDVGVVRACADASTDEVTDSFAYRFAYCKGGPTSPECSGSALTS